MKAVNDKPMVVFAWLGNVDQWVAIEHLRAAGRISESQADTAKKEMRNPGNRYSRGEDGAKPGFGKIQPLAAFLGSAVEYHILSDHDAIATGYFRDWLSELGYTVVVHPVPLESPSDYGEVYEKVDSLLTEVEKTRSPADFNYGFYLASGTRAMASVWLLLARTRFNGNVYHWGAKDPRPSLVQLPFDIDLKFLPAVEARRAAALAMLRDNFPDEALADISGTSRAILAAKDVAAQYAVLPYDVLLIGETGTGKEKFARCIHSASFREKKPFVAVNCGELTDSLFPSRMFGHRKGAFTDAKTDQDGLMQNAHTGTLFLDEVGELTVVMQAALLRALQPLDDRLPTRRHIRPVGASADEMVDVRIIAATNRNLAEMVKRGEFREDLLQRLDYLTIRLPSLGERKEDIPGLIERFLDDINAACRIVDSKSNPKALLPQAVKILQAAHWPGNVRQLKKVLARAHAFAFGSDINGDDILRALANDAFALPAQLPVLERPIGNGFALGVVETEVRAHYFIRAFAEGETQAQAARLLGYETEETFRQQLGRLVDDTTLRPSLRDRLRHEQERTSSKRCRRERQGKRSGT